MTCCVALAHEGKVYMGADSVGDSGWTAQAYKQRKLIRLPGMVFGYTTSYRAGQILKLGMATRMPSGEPGEAASDYMIRWADVARQLWREGGQLTTKEGVDSGAELVVGLAGRVFIVSTDLSVIEPECGYGAVGSGTSQANGSLYTTGRPFLIDRMDPILRVSYALNAAAAHASGVGPLFHFEILSE